MSSDLHNFCLLPNCTAKLSDFRGGRRLGGGGQGEVRILSDHNNQVFACKIEKATHSYVKRELDLVFNPIHSNYLVKFHHLFLENGFYYIVMDYCEGGSLDAFIVPSRFGPFASIVANEDLWFIFCQLVAGLAVLHHHGIVHRDVKPANVLLVNEGKPYRIKYCDFGISKSIEETSGATCIGTHGYMAPEVFQEKYGFKCDLWSLGVLMYSLTEGKLPFDCRVPNYSKLLTFSNDNQFVEIITKLLVVDPDLRMGLDDIINMPRFREAWSTYMDGEPLPSREVTPLLHSRTFSDLSVSLYLNSAAPSHIIPSDTVTICQSFVNQVDTVEVDLTTDKMFVSIVKLTKSNLRVGSFMDFPSLGFRLLTPLVHVSERPPITLTTVFYLRISRPGGKHDADFLFSVASLFAQRYCNNDDVKRIERRKYLFSFTFLPLSVTTTSLLTQLQDLSTFIVNSFEFEGLNCQLYSSVHAFTCFLPVVRFKPVNEFPLIQKSLANIDSDLRLLNCEEVFVNNDSSWGHVSCEFLQSSAVTFNTVRERLNSKPFKLDKRSFPFIFKNAMDYTSCSIISYLPSRVPHNGIVNSFQMKLGDEYVICSDGCSLYCLSREGNPLLDVPFSTLPLNRTVQLSHFTCSIKNPFLLPTPINLEETHVSFVRENYLTLIYNDRLLSRVSTGAPSVSSRLIQALHLANTFLYISTSTPYWFFSSTHNHVVCRNLCFSKIENSFISLNSVPPLTSLQVSKGTSVEFTEQLLDCCGQSDFLIINFTHHERPGGDYLYGSQSREAALLTCSTLAVALDPQSISITPVTQVPTYPLGDTIVVSKNIEIFRQQDLVNCDSIPYQFVEPSPCSVLSCSLPVVPALTPTDFSTAEYSNNDVFYQTFLIIDSVFRTAISQNYKSIFIDLRYFEEQGHPLIPICNILVVMNSWYRNYLRKIVFKEFKGDVNWQQCFEAAKASVCPVKLLDINDSFFSRLEFLPRCNIPECSSTSTSHLLLFH
ncbi:hypothetical protein RCL1_001264 [Eukaryota sp. TZLM3-RCL]